MPESFHPQIRIRHGEISELVDVELAPLLIELWRADIVTLSSCQDAGESINESARSLPHMAAEIASLRGRAYVDLRHLDDACAVLTMVANGGTRDSFYERMAHWSAPNAWNMRVMYADWGLEEGEELAKDGTRLSLFDVDGWQLAFPRKDIPLITERFRRSRTKGPVDDPGEPTWESVSLGSGEVP